MSDESLSTSIKFSQDFEADQKVLDYLYKFNKNEWGSVIKTLLYNSITLPTIGGLLNTTGTPTVANFASAAGTAKISKVDKKVLSPEEIQKKLAGEFND